MTTVNIQSTTLVVLKTADGNIFKKSLDIVRFEAAGKYTFVFTLNNDKPERILGCISDIEDRLKNNHVFFKCHRSHIINIIHIKKYVRKTGCIITENGEVPISASFVKKFEDCFCI